MKWIAAACLALLTGCIDQDEIRNSVVFNPDRDVNEADGGPVSAELRQTDVYKIHDNGGGRILIAEAQRRELLNWGGKVEISGFCASACAIFTTLPNACLRPGSRIGFHSSNINFGPVGNVQIARFLRGGVKRRYNEEWQFVPNDSMKLISAEEYVSLDPKSQLCSS